MMPKPPNLSVVVFTLLAAARMEIPAAAAVAVPEGTAATTPVVTVAAPANRSVEADVIYNLIPEEDAAAFDLDGATGALTFKVAPDYENPTDTDGDNLYRVTVSATDASGPLETQKISIRVTNAVSVFLLAGQSNMVGGVPRAELPAGLARPYPNVKIWQLISDTFVDLQPGFAGGTWSAFGEGFGPEISFGRAIAGRATEEVYLIKYGLGATSLAEDWAPGDRGNQHGIFVRRVATALASLSRQDITYTVEGMAWMQGENDAFESAAFASRYQANLTSFIADMRRRYNPALKFAIGRLHDDLPSGFYYAADIRAAQAAVAAADPLTYLVDTDAYSVQADAVHFDAAGQIALGEGFAAVLGD